MTKEKGGLPLRIALATQWRSPSSAATPEGVFSCDNGASKGEASWRSNKICRHEMDDFSTLLKGIYTGNTTNIRNSSLCLDDDILLHSANMITFSWPKSFAHNSGLWTDSRRVFTASWRKLVPILIQYYLSLLPLLAHFAQPLLGVVAPLSGAS